MADKTKKCQLCGVNDVSVHYTEIINGKVRELHICQNCATQKGFQSDSGNSAKYFSLADLLSGILDASKEHEPDSKVGPLCDTCGMSYANFRKVGRFGCADCYRYFDALLEKLMRRLHGSEQHKGKFPGSRQSVVISSDREINKLREALNRAVEHEKYELAAQLRDKIKALLAEVENTPPTVLPEAENTGEEGE